MVVYVAPTGATAASAGCFITLAANVAAMAPATTIGAAHPVSLGGFPSGDQSKPDQTMTQKLENFAVSYMEAIASRRSRNVEWAKSAVRESASITAEKAQELKVIEIIAPRSQRFAQPAQWPDGQWQAAQNQRRASRGNQNVRDGTIFPNVLAAGGHVRSDADRDLWPDWRDDDAGRNPAGSDRGHRSGSRALHGGDSAGQRGRIALDRFGSCAVRDRRVRADAWRAHRRRDCGLSRSVL